MKNTTYSFVCELEIFKKTNCLISCQWDRWLPCCPASQPHDWAQGQFKACSALLRQLPESKVVVFSEGIGSPRQPVAAGEVALHTWAARALPTANEGPHVKMVVVAVCKVTSSAIRASLEDYILFPKINWVRIKLSTEKNINLCQIKNIDESICKKKKRRWIREERSPERGGDTATVMGEIPLSHRWITGQLFGPVQ